MWGLKASLSHEHSDMAKFWAAQQAYEHKENFPGFCRAVAFMPLDTMCILPNITI